VVEYGTGHDNECQRHDGGYDEAHYFGALLSDALLPLQALQGADREVGRQRGPLLTRESLFQKVRIAVCFHI